MWVCTLHKFTVCVCVCVCVQRQGEGLEVDVLTCSSGPNELVSSPGLSFLRRQIVEGRQGYLMSRNSSCLFLFVLNNNNNNMDNALT